MSILIFVFQKPIFSHIISSPYLSSDFKIRIIWSSVNIWLLSSSPFLSLQPCFLYHFTSTFWINGIPFLHSLFNFLPYSLLFSSRFPSIFPSLHFFFALFSFLCMSFFFFLSPFLVCLFNFYSFDIFFNIFFLFFPPLHFYFLRYFYFRF